MLKKLFVIVLGVCLIVGGSVSAVFADNGQPPAGQTASRQDRLRRPRGGEITAIGADSLTLTGPKGVSKTIQVTAQTQYLDQDGQALTFADLTVGQRVVVAAARKDGDTITALWIKVFPKQTHYTGVGVVTAVTEATLAFTSRQGKSWEFTVDEATVYTDKAGKTHSLAEVKPGTILLVKAELRTDGKWWATVIGFPKAATQP